MKPQFNSKDTLGIWYKQNLSMPVDKLIVYNSKILGVCSFKTVLVGTSAYYKFY